jgi:transposase
VAEFQTTVQGLLALRDWLDALKVKQVAMEATGVYWKPVWAILEDRFELMLVNARHVKQVPGRKTDVSDAAWLCRLAEAGLLRASFVPPKPIRQLRQLTRYRRAQIAERQREANRLHKALEDTGIKLDCVATDILGVSGRAMLDALCRGTTDPEVLADLARGKLRKKLPALTEALEGRFDSLHALLVGSILAHLDFLDEQIDRLSLAIEEQLAPFAAAVELLRSIPGVETRTAQVIIAEIGTDMSVFPTAGHLASWARQAPRVTESAGKRKGKNATGRGNPYIGGTLGEASVSVGRTQTFLGAKYRRLCTHMPRKKAQGAIMRTQLVIAHALLSDPEARYEDLGPDYYERKADTRRRARSHVRGLERLGYKVSIEAIDPGTGELLPVATDR